MFKELIEAIQSGVQPEIIKINGQDYSTRAVYLPPKEPEPESMRVSSLTGLVDYLNSGDIADMEGILIHVESPTHVAVKTPISGRHLQRITMCDAIYASPFEHPHMDVFSRFHSIENFIIALQTLFFHNEQRAQVLEIVGNLQSEVVTTSEDDGVTQQVGVRRGVKRLGTATIENPVSLIPKRSFPEIPQTLTPFVLRLEKGKDGELPKVGLFECDGGAWKLTTVNAIKAWLKENNVTLPIIG